jgi:hypothetical protein
MGGFYSIYGTAMGSIRVTVLMLAIEAKAPLVTCVSLQHTSRKLQSTQNIRT